MPSGGENCSSIFLHVAVWLASNSWSVKCGESFFSVRAIVAMAVGFKIELKNRIINFWLLMLVLF